MDVIMLNKGFYIVKARDEWALERTQSEGPIVGSCLSLRYGNSVCFLGRLPSQKIPVWAKLCNVPLELFSEVLVI